MGEMQELEKKAKEAYVKERFDELGQYMERLFSELDVAHAVRYKHATMMLAVAGVWWIAIMAHGVFGGPVLTITMNVAMCLYFAVWMTEWVFVLPHYFGIIYELEGCLKTLEILGMLDKRRDGDRRIKKYKESWMFKMWEALKSQKMRSAFA